MKNPLAFLDSQMINMLEKMTHRFQRHFHRTNFWLAKWCLTLDVFLLFFGLLVRSRDGRITLIDMFFIPIMLLAAFFYANYYWRVEEHKALKRCTHGEANPRKISSNAALVRWCLLAVVVFSIVSTLPLWVHTFQFIVTNGSVLMTLIIIMIFVFTVFLLMTIPLFFYLIACDPIPPSEEKAREVSGDTKLARARN